MYIPSQHSLVLRSLGTFLVTLLHTFKCLPTNTRHLEHYLELGSHDGGNPPYFLAAVYLPELSFFLSRDIYTRKKKALGRYKLVILEFIYFLHLYCFASRLRADSYIHTHCLVKQIIRIHIIILCLNINKRIPFVSRALGDVP